MSGPPSGPVFAHVVQPDGLHAYKTQQEDTQKLADNNVQTNKQIPYLSCGIYKRIARSKQPSTLLDRPKGFQTETKTPRHGDQDTQTCIHVGDFSTATGSALQGFLMLPVSPLPPFLTTLLGIANKAQPHSLTALGSIEIAWSDGPGA